MATLSQILSHGWPGQGWSCSNPPSLADAYATLNWSGPAPKPSLAEIEAMNAATDAALLVEALKGRQVDELVKERDAFLTAFDIIGDAFQEIVTKFQLRAGQTLDPTIVNRVQAFRAKVAAAKAIT